MYLDKLKILISIERMQKPYIKLLLPIYKPELGGVHYFLRKEMYDSVKSGVYGGGDQNRIWS